jgi:hypothetical protein
VLGQQGGVVIPQLRAVQPAWQVLPLECRQPLQQTRCRLVKAPLAISRLPTCCMCMGNSLLECMACNILHDRSFWARFAALPQACRQQAVSGGHLELRQPGDHRAVDVVQQLAIVTGSQGAELGVAQQPQRRRRQPHPPVGRQHQMQILSPVGNLRFRSACWSFSGLDWSMVADVLCDIATSACAWYVTAFLCCLQHASGAPTAAFDHNQAHQHLQKQIGLVVGSGVCRPAHPLQDIMTLLRPQLAAYMPVGVLYMRLRRSGFTQKYSAAVMLALCWQPTGKLSPHTAHCASAPNLQQHDM